MAWFRKKNPESSKPEKKSSTKKNSQKSPAPKKQKISSKASEKQVILPRPVRKEINFPDRSDLPVSKKELSPVSQKKIDAPAPSLPQEEKPELYSDWTSPVHEFPNGYGDNHIYLLVRDPHWIYSYWEIQPDYHHEKLRCLGGSPDDVSTILRVFDVSDPQNTSVFADIHLQNVVDHWFINVQPNRSYIVEIGLLHKDGRYVMLARSNQVTTPRAGMSDVIDERWMDIDFEKMYALSGGFEVGKSSAELQKLMEERLRGAITSGSGVGGISSMGSPVRKQQRGFWFVLDCELIVYGATEPDAKVTLQGKPIRLRPDGTFTCRFALPDSVNKLDAKAISADGLEERNIIPTVTRTTERPEPIVKSES